MTKQQKILAIAASALLGACVSLSTLTSDFADRSSVARKLDNGKTELTLKCQRASLEGVQLAKRDAIAALLTKKRASELRDAVYEACKQPTEVQHDMVSKPMVDGGVDAHKVDAQ